MSDIPDWLKGDDKPALTPEEVRREWEKFLALDLYGRIAWFTNKGGDMWHVEGMIEVVEQRDDAIVMRLRNTKWFRDWISSERPLLADGMPKEEFVLLTDHPPEFGKNNAIVLPCGVVGAIGLELDLGFVEPRSMISVPSIHRPNDQ